MEENKKKFWRYLYNKKERWGLTLVGWVCAAFITVAVAFAIIPKFHAFLAVQDRVKADILVVEGWIPDSTIPGAVSEFRGNDYELMVLVGAPILVGGHLSGYKSYSELTRARLKALGFDEEKIVVLEATDVKKDRTYQSAQGVKKWLASTGAKARGLNVYTLGVHARRSRLLFKQALGKDFPVGVVPASDQSYDPDYWWKSSNGFRWVMDELIAYLYTRVVFNP